MPDLEKRIIKLLESEGPACPPALIAFKMPTYAFDEIVAALRHLEELGTLRAEAAGIVLVSGAGADTETPGFANTEDDTTAAAPPEKPERTATLANNVDFRRAGDSEPYISYRTAPLQEQIIDLLDKMQVSCTPSYIALRLSEHGPEKVLATINELKAEGVVEISPQGVRLTPMVKNSYSEAISPAAATAAPTGDGVGQPEKTTDGKRRVSARRPSSHIFDGMTDQAIDAYFESIQSGAGRESHDSEARSQSPANQDAAQEEATEAEFDGRQGGALPVRYSDSIDVLGLSARPSGALNSNGIRTILDLALYESLGSIRNLGSTSINEIHKRLKDHALTIDQGAYSQFVSWYGAGLPKQGFIFDQFGTLCELPATATPGQRHGVCPVGLRKLPIKELELTPKARLALEQGGIKTIEDLCTCSPKILRREYGLSYHWVSRITEALTGLGAALAPEEEHVLSEISAAITTPKQIVTLSSSAWLAARLLEERKIPLYEPMANLWLNHEFEEVVAKSDAISEHLNALLDNLASGVERACEADITRWAEECQAKMDVGYAETQTRDIPADIRWQKAAATACAKLSRLHYVPEESKLLFKPPALDEWIDSLPDDRATRALKIRLGGHTLEEASAELGVTRERARQLQEKLLKKAPVLREDGYGPLFEKYKVDQALFCKIANCGPEVYRYLELRYRGKRRQTSHIAAAQQDTSVPESARQAINAYLIAKSRKGMVQMDGAYVRTDRKSAVICAMKRLASSGSELVDADTLYAELKGLVRDHGFPKNILSSGSRGLFSWIQRTDYIMAPMQKHLRLHNFSDYEYDDLRDCLEVMSKQNIECSAQLVFETWPDVMSGLDIRDCNELHYTIKTQLGEECPGVYSLGRNPMMTLGKADRFTQVKELIEEMAPVSRNDLANEYNRRYRVSQASFLASFLGDFQQYRSGNIYSIKSKGFTDEERDYVLSILDGCDYFPLSLARQQFRGTFPASKAAICDESLQPLGYSISQSLVVKDGVNIRRAFAKAIEGLDKFKEGDDGLSPDVFAHSQLASELNMRLRNLSLVECGPRQYVKTQYLTKMYDVTKADIEQFIHVVSNSIPAGEPFTVQRLRGMGLSHKVDNALVTGEFDDGLLQGMLSAGTTTTGLRTSSIGNTTLFCSGVNSIDAPRYIESVIQREGPLELEDLLDILDREHGIATTAPFLRQLIQRSTLFYVPSLNEMIFSSENDYNDYVNDLLNG